MTTKFSKEEEKILETVFEEWLEEFRTIFKKNKRNDIDNFLFYAKHSFIEYNVFRYAYELIDNHPKWEDWEDYARQFYYKSCIYKRKISTISLNQI
jgi:hypothetical protein